MFQLFALLLMSTLSHAEMGFHSVSDALPLEARQIEHATVAVYSYSTQLGKYPLGTAVLVATKREKKNLFGYFLTNAHVSRSLAGLGTSQGPEIYYHYRHTSMPGSNSSSGTSVNPISKDAWNTSIVGVLKEDRNVDLALFKARIPLSYEAENTVPQISEWHVGRLPNDRVIAIGNPSLGSRWNQNSAFYPNGKPIPSNIRETFWSSGVAEYETSYKLDKRMQDTLVHDADLLPGMSGGPLINFKGELIGINRNIRVVNSQKQYNSAFESGAVPAASIIGFLKTVSL